MAHSYRIQGLVGPLVMFDERARQRIDILGHFGALPRRFGMWIFTVVATSGRFREGFVHAAVGTGPVEPAGFRLAEHEAAFMLKPVVMPTKEAEIVVARAAAVSVVDGVVRIAGAGRCGAARSAAGDVAGGDPAAQSRVREAGGVVVLRWRAWALVAGRRPGRTDSWCDIT
jgi:hypothetical protein